MPPIRFLPKQLYDRCHVATVDYAAGWPAAGASSGSHRGAAQRIYFVNSQGAFSTDPIDASLATLTEESYLPDASSTSAAAESVFERAETLAAVAAVVAVNDAVSDPLADDHLFQADSNFVDDDLVDLLCLQLQAG